MADRAVEACRAYAHWQGEIRRLSRIIGDNLCNCAGIKGERQKVGDLDTTHLSELYKGYGDEDWQGCPTKGHYSHTEVVEHLVESGCEYCLTAHHQIQERKAARQKLGAAKRWITRLGKQRATTKE